MAEPFNTTIRLHGEDARRFHNYDNNPSKYQSEKGRKAAKRAQAIASRIRL